MSIVRANGDLQKAAALYTTLAKKPGLRVFSKDRGVSERQLKKKLADPNYQIPYNNKGGRKNSLDDAEYKQLHGWVQAREEDRIRGAVDARDIVLYVKTEFSVDVSESWARKLHKRLKTLWQKPFLTSKQGKTIFEREIRDFHATATAAITGHRQKSNIINFDEMHVHGKPTQGRKVMVTKNKAGQPIIKFFCNVRFYITLVTSSIYANKSILKYLTNDFCVFVQICCITVPGYFIPPAIIFAGEDIDPEAVKAWEQMKAAFFCSHSGYINDNIYLQVIKHFDSFLAPVAPPEMKTLAFVDNHDTR